MSTLHLADLIRDRLRAVRQGSTTRGAIDSRKHTAPCQRLVVQVNLPMLQMGYWREHLEAALPYEHCQMPSPRMSKPSTQYALYHRLRASQPPQILRLVQQLPSFRGAIAPMAPWQHDVSYATVPTEWLLSRRVHVALGVMWAPWRPKLSATHMLLWEKAWLIYKPRVQQLRLHTRFLDHLVAAFVLTAEVQRATATYLSV
jgi:hypothetical protein